MTDYAPFPKSVATPLERDIESRLRDRAARWVRSDNRAMIHCGQEVLRILGGSA